MRTVLSIAIDESADAVVTCVNLSGLTKMDIAQALAELEVLKMELVNKYENADEASKAYRNFLHHYAPELEGKTAVNLEDGKWTGSRVEQELLICVFNGETEEAVDSLIDSAYNSYLSSKD